jgi:hypothetical protein
MGMDEASEMANRINDAIGKKKKDDFKNNMGVEKKDFDAYRRDFDRVQPQIDSLSKTFDAVIQRRKTYRRVLRRSTEEGVMMHPARGAIAVAEIQAGGEPGKVMLDYESKEVIRHRPRRIEFTLVCDGSGSMKDSLKQVLQRRLAVLATEAFVAFQERILKERRAGEKLGLDVFSEVRMFDDKDTVLKPLTTTFSHVERVKMHRHLKEFPGGSNNEPATFEAIRSEQFSKAQIQDLQKGDVKKIILFLTDGESDAGAIQAQIEAMQRLARDPKTGDSSLVIAGLGFEGGTSAQTTYAPNGYYAPSLEEVPKIFETFISQILDDV